MNLIMINNKESMVLKKVSKNSLAYPKTDISGPIFQL